MDLIIGGAYQGKLTRTVEKFGLTEDELCDLAVCAPMPGKRCYYHAESFTRAACVRGKTAKEAADLLLSLGDDVIIIAREIGCGVVPNDAEERAWRELHGAVLRALAQRARTVTRIFCGLAEELK